MNIRGLLQSQIADIKNPIRDKTPGCVAAQKKKMSESKLVARIRKKDPLTYLSIGSGEACIDSLRYEIFSHARCSYKRIIPALLSTTVSL